MLPTCPSCGQSVLDDDATECPFCGESMSGKGKKKPKPAPAAKPAATAKKKPKPAAKKPKSDDPFDAAPVRTTTAIQAAPKPMKGRLLKVVCPMCDTAGFIPRKAAGREVRCANKGCMVPVFKSKAPQRQTEGTNQQPESGSPVVPIILGVVALAVVGGVVYMIMGQKPDGTDISKNNTPPPTQPKEDILKEYLKDQAGPGEVAAKTRTLVELRDETLEALVETAAKSNDNKPFCRLMTAEAYAASGMIEKAESELGLIAKPGMAKFYQRAIALSQISDAYLAAGDKAKAADSAKKALEAAGSLPQFGQTEFEIRSLVGRALVAAGELDSAVSFVAACDRDLEEPLTYRSALAAAERSIALADVDSKEELLVPARVGDWEDPTWVAIATDLCMRGHSDAAVQWSSRASDPAVRIDSLASVAGYLAAAGNQSIADAAVAAAGSDPAAMARVNAAAAYGAALGKKETAATYLAAAEKAAAGLPAPKPVLIPDARELYDFVTPDAQPARIAAAAMAELARAQAEVKGSGEDTLLVALEHTHTFCPTPEFIQARMNENLTASQLAGALKISPAEARTALNKFRSKVKTLKKVCDRRRQLQSEMLAQLSTSKLGDAVWKLVKPDAGPNVLKAELLRNSSLPWRAALGFLKAGQLKKGRGILDALGTCDRPVVQSQIDGILNSDLPPASLAAMLSPQGEREPARLASVLGMAKKLASSDATKAATFAKSVGNPLWKLDALRIAGTQGAKSGQSREMLEFVRDLDLESPGRTAIYRGFVSGIAMDSEFESGGATP